MVAGYWHILRTEDGEHYIEITWSTSVKESRDQPINGTLN